MSHDENKTFGVVSWFIQSKNDEAQNLGTIALDLLKECFSKEIGDWDADQSTIIPLFICDKRDDLKKSGVLCPHELVIERTDLLPGVDDKGQLTYDAKDVLTSRLNVLKSLYGRKSRKDFKEYMRDWLAGAFRMYLMLDSTTHGTSEFIDLEKVKERREPILMYLAGYSFDDIKQQNDGYPCNEEQENNIKKHKKILEEKFARSIDIHSEIQKFKQHAIELFSDYFYEWDTKDEKIKENVGRSIVKALKLSDKKDIFEALCSIYCDADKKFNENKKKFEPLEHSDRLPVAFGDRSKYVTATGKLNLLLIDDNVKNSPLANLNNADKVPSEFKSNISKDDWKLLREIFNVQLMPVNKKDGEIYQTAARNFREFHKKGLTFDLILVDLCLGNNHQGEDLDGYSMIRIVKAFFPGTPIVVYSRFSDMEHIARAFFNGAKWFLIKGEEAKLPRHVLKLLKQVGWHKEWRSVKNSFHAPKFLFEQDNDFSRRFERTEQWKYLTYKCLENFPGKYITIHKMSGGISGAVTFRATKGVKLGDEFLQTPCIIKIDASYKTMMEFERYDRMIRPYIANECGRVEMPERILNRKYSSIVYTFAGKQDQAHIIESMGAMLDDNIGCQTACDYEAYRYSLQCVFDEILPKIHHVSPELEFADIEKSSVLPSDVMDAFTWKDDAIHKSSFPNFYYSEFQPKDFWKSYMIRMQPWGRISIKFDSQIPEWPFQLQGSTKAKKRLIFHDVMIDPFAKKGDRISGSRIIEAYTSDGKLVWLDGEACDFVSRFRKCISPGNSLWFDQLDAVDDDGKLSIELWGENGKIIKNGIPDGRVQWLEDTFNSNHEENANAKKDFCKAIFYLASKNVSSDDLNFYIDLQDGLIEIAQQTAEKAEEWDMKCPVGIVHGDLNLKNIMLESRKHPPKEDDPDVTKTVSDVWLIDFARTRRDLIAHDFNVFFSSVLGELFAVELIAKDGKGITSHQQKYWDDLIPRFKALISAAVDPKVKSEKGVPDEIKDDRRLTLIYRILRRTHDAAIAAGISQNMYLLTTALTCFYTVKISLKNDCNVRLAAGQFVAAWICYDLLCKAIDKENKMKKYETIESKPNPVSNSVKK